MYRLADFFDTPREHVLALATGFQVASQTEGQSHAAHDNDYLIQELLAEFRRIPDEWKPVAIQEIELIRRLAERPSNVTFMLRSLLKEGRAG